MTDDTKASDTDEGIRVEIQSIRSHRVAQADAFDFVPAEGGDKPEGDYSRAAAPPGGGIADRPEGDYSRDALHGFAPLEGGDWPAGDEAAAFDDGGLVGAGQVTEIVR